MRKIESLQENERVFVKSEQWREAARLFNFCAMPLDDIFVGKNEVGYFWETTITSASKLYKLKDFLPNKKSKTKQRLKALEERMDKLEWYHKGLVRFDLDNEYQCKKDEPPKAINAVERVDEPKEIDFSVAGQYLVASRGLIVMTVHKPICEDTFTAVVIEKGNNSVYRNGHENNSWIRSKFKLLTEPITINPQP